MGNFPSNDAGVADTPGTATAARQEDAHVEIMATPGREPMATGENAISGAQLRGSNVETVQPAGLNPSVYTGDSGLETELGTQSPIASSHSQYYPHDFYFEEDEMGVRRSTPFTRGRRYIQERRQIWTPSETPYSTPMVSLVDMDQETAAYFEHMRRRVPLSPPLSDRVEFATNEQDKQSLMIGLRLGVRSTQVSLCRQTEVEITELLTAGWILLHLDHLDKWT